MNNIKTFTKKEKMILNYSVSNSWDHLLNFKVRDLKNNNDNDKKKKKLKYLP